MDNVGAAILFSQPIVGRACVEEQHSPGAPRISRLQQQIGRKVGDHHRHTLIGQRVDCRRRIVAGFELDVIERETLLQKTAGGVVIIDGEFGARQPIIGRGLLDE